MADSAQRGLRFSTAICATPIVPAPATAIRSLGEEVMLPLVWEWGMLATSHLNGRITG